MLWLALALALLSIGAIIVLAVKMQNEENRRPYIISLCVLGAIALICTIYCAASFVLIHSRRNEPPDDTTTAVSETELESVSGTDTETDEVLTTLKAIDPTVSIPTANKNVKPTKPAVPDIKPYFHPDPLGFTKLKYDKNPILKNTNEITKYALHMFISGNYDLTFYIPRNEMYSPMTVMSAAEIVRTYYLFGSCRIFNANTEDLGDKRGITARFTITKYNTDTDKQTYKVAQDYVKKHPAPDGGFKSFNAEKQYMKQVHDYVAKLVEYNPMGFNPHSLYQTNIYDAKQEAYNALIEHSAVCAGYAKAVALIAQTAGIDCAWMWGNDNGYDSHAWNIVFPCDGSEPVVVDATWDDHYNEDSPESPLYDYFYIPVSKDEAHRADPAMWSFLEYLHK